MTGLTWLHLSDWHQKGKDFDQKVVRDNLIEDLLNRKNISQDLAKIDFIVFSGDVAFSGQSEEYQTSKKEFFKPILKACGLGPEKLFIVPGNHDLDRSKFELLPSSLMEPLESDNQAKEWLFDRKKRSHALIPFEAFTSFVSRYTHQKNPDYVNIRQYEVNGKKIALLGLNSAWMCGRRKDSKDEIDDKGVVVVGEPQIYDLQKTISDIKIAVLHHPFDWLNDFESSQIEKSLVEHCDFILCGHQHKSHASRIQSTYGDCVIIPAGACYYRRAYANAYNFVHLNFETGKGVVFQRCWNGKDKWRQDIDSSTDGKFEFDICESTPKDHQPWNGSQKNEKCTPTVPTPREKKPSQIFTHSDSTKFARCFEQLAGKAKRIVLIGIGLNILHNESLFISIMKRVRRRECDLEIYLANPFSPAVETRLIEEEIGDRKPPVGKAGLIKRLFSIIEEQKKMGTPSNFVLKVFPNYPTFAMFILDDDYFFYPYGFTLLGNHSPVFHFSMSNPDHGPMTEFLQRQYESVKEASAEAQPVLGAQGIKRANVEKFLSYAVYLVPNASSDIYKFSSTVIGYDLRNRCILVSPWAEYVGSAADFGFHLTVADALYYSCQRDIDLMCKEVEFVAQELRPFSLRFKIQERFPNKSSISLVCSDESGTLESLHHELVFRCYRQAIASNYSLELAPIDRDSSLSRARLMIRRYRAPYILQRFQPHFTLFTNVPAEKMNEVARKVKEIYHQEVKEQQIDIMSIAVMTKPRMDTHWQILQEVPL